MSEMNRSVFLSLHPLQTNKYNDKEYTLNDFLYLCSDCYPTYTIDYLMTTFGFPREDTSKALAIDGMSGAIGRIQISGTRVGSIEFGSNAYFTKEIRRMRTRWQLDECAYILRIYNSILPGPSPSSDTNKNRSKFETEKSYNDIFVYLKRINYALTGGQPTVMSVDISLVQRAGERGVNVYVPPY